MKRGPWANDLEAIHARAVDKVIQVGVLVDEIGMPEGTVYRLCRHRGPWQLVAPATVLLETGTPTRRQLLRAGFLHAGPDAVVTGLDAARAHQLYRGRLPDAVHLLIRAGSRIQGTSRIVIERTTRLPPPLLRDGFPVAPVERCVLDAARRLRAESEIAAILTEPVQRRMVLPGMLRAELDAGCRKGSSTPRAVLRAIEHGVRSAAEFDVHQWWFAQPELPEDVLFNVRITGDGRFVGIADVFVPEAGLVIPIDSVEHHFATPDQVEETERQHRAYRSVGLHVMGLRPTRVRRDPAGLLRDVLDAIAVARSLPTPAVEWAPDLPVTV
jgi:very-short-patch-repair endonuclease